MSAEKGNTKYKFIKTPTRKFVQIDVQLNKEENQTQKILTQINKHDIKDAVIKILYYVPSDTKDTVKSSKTTVNPPPSPVIQNDFITPNSIPSATPPYYLPNTLCSYRL